MAGSIKVLGNASLGFGTCELGTTFGQIEDGSLTLTGDIETIPDCCGGLQSVLLTNERYELEFNVILNSGATLPTRGQGIVFPVSGIAGSVLEWTVKWTAGKSKMLSIKATHWASLGSGAGSTAGPAVSTVGCS